MAQTGPALVLVGSPGALPHGAHAYDSESDAIKPDNFCLHFCHYVPAMPQACHLKAPRVLAGKGVCPHKGRPGAEALPAEGLRGGDCGGRLLGQALHL